jgi:hypothetical protein
MDDCFLEIGRPFGKHFMSLDTLTLQCHKRAADKLSSYVSDHQPWKMDFLTLTCKTCQKVAQKHVNNILHAQQFLLS